jgi:lipid-A-disaccharide synthase
VAGTGPLLRIGIVAAEPSGDQLAAGLMQALRDALPEVRFEGIGGPRMQRVGLDSWAPMEQLSVMGLVEVLRHLPRLLRLRGRLAARWRDAPPALFIGVDAPDFNLTLERRLRERGVPTVHYVSPTVWAWRTGRVRTIRRAIDLLLVIFPFEPDFLARYDIRARYVGHRLANRYPAEPDRAGARAKLGLPSDAPVLALLPGSRVGEVGRLAGPFLEAAAMLRRELADLHCVTPLVNAKTRELFEDAHARVCPDLPLTRAMEATPQALAACDVALVASGTATFEGLLSKRPMVVGYRVNGLTYALARALRLVRVSHVAMANLLADEPLAPELIQGRCTADNLAAELRALFGDPARRERIASHYAEVHDRLRLDTDTVAAEAVVALLQDRGSV